MINQEKITAAIATLLDEGVASQHEAMRLMWHAGRLYERQAGEKERISQNLALGMQVSPGQR